MHLRILSILFIILASNFPIVEATARDGSPSLYFEESIPENVVTRLSNDGYRLIKNSKIIAANDRGIHYFILLGDTDGGCGIADFDVKRWRYKIIDSYGQCKVASPPMIKYLFGDGSQAIVVKLELQSNGHYGGEAIQTNAYVYEKASSEFCRNDDAGGFANGTRVPDSVIRFRASICR